MDRRKKWLSDNYSEFDLPPDFTRSSGASPFKKIYVVTLPERLDHVITFLRSNGFNYDNVSIFRAINKNDLNFSELESLGFVEQGGELQPGEHACTLSHMAVYNNFYNRADTTDSDWCCVFEDDNVATLPEVEREVNDFVKKVNALARRRPKKLRNNTFYEIPNIHYLGFCYCNKHALSRHVVPGVAQSLSHFCTHGYFLNKPMIDYFFANASFPFAQPIDNMLRDMFTTGDVLSFFSTTNLFKQNRADIPSAIKDREENYTFVDGPEEDFRAVFVPLNEGSARFVMYSGDVEEGEFEVYESNTWLIAGIIIGLVVLIVLVIVGFFVYRNRQKQIVY
jgi:GR25 family glycosyltransferase involved in LPS biosynthesis